MGNVGYNINAQCPTERERYNQCQSSYIKRVMNDKSGIINPDTVDNNCYDEFQELKECTYEYIRMRQKQYLERKLNKSLNNNNNTDITNNSNNDESFDNIKTFDISDNADNTNTNQNNM